MPSRPTNLTNTFRTVLRVDHTAEVDHDPVAGFMDAMTMSYPVSDTRALSTLARGDEIRADVVVVDSAPHLENVVIAKRHGKS